MDVKGYGMASILKRIDQLRPRKPAALLSIAKILVWADQHRAATGSWPSNNSGRISQSPVGATWKGIDWALKKGLNGAPGISLARLLHERRGKKLNVSAERERSLVNRSRSGRSGRVDGGNRLSVEQILAWADAHYVAKGRWPTTSSGPVAGVRGENWRTVGDGSVIWVCAACLAVQTCKSCCSFIAVRRHGTCLPISRWSRF